MKHFIQLLSLSLFTISSVIAVSPVLADSIVTSSLTSSVAAKNDDAEENTETGELSRRSSDLELLRDRSAIQLVGLRFGNINIPQGATITDARIQFRADETSSGAVTLDIQGEDVDNAATFSGQYGISSRAVTTATVSWTPDDWTVVNEAGEAQRTPDLSSIVQEIVNRPGWQREHALSFIIRNASTTKKRVADSFEGGAPAVLSISYSYLSEPPVIDPIPNKLLDVNSPVGTTVMQVNAYVPDNATINWRVIGNVPFSIDNQGNIVVDAALQAGVYQFEIQADNNGVTSNAPVNVTVVQAVSTATITASIIAKNDDAEENIATGDVSRTSSDLELLRDADTTQLVGLRFQHINIPQGATINDVRIQFRTDEKSSGDVTINIKGENTDNAAAFAGQYNISSRSTTTAAVDWTPANWTVRNERGAAQGTPNLFAVVQEIVNRAGWQPNNALSFILSGTGSNNKRVADSFEGGAPASLSISYSVANVAPVIGATTDRLLDVNTPAGTSVMTVHVSEPKDADITWTIADSVPFSIDAQGNITVSAALQTGTYQFAVQANNSGMTSTAPVSITVAESVATETMTVSITGKNDDVEENAETGDLSRRSSDLELLYDRRAMQLVGLRFDNIDIPQGAIINDARIQFQADETSSGPVTMSIRGENVDSAAIFKGQYGVSSRAATSAAVSWTPDEWTLVGEAGEAQRTPNLSTVVQEIVNRAGWQREHALSFIISQANSTNKRVAESFEGGAPATLSISYSYLSESPVIDAVPHTLLDVSSPTNTTVLQIGAHVQGNAVINWTIADNVPFRIDGQGNIIVNTALQTGVYQFEIQADNNGATSKATVKITAIEAVSTATITAEIATKSDDAEENIATGKVSRASSDLELLRDGDSVQLVGLRFQNINIPQGAIINDVRIQFRADEKSSGDVTIGIKGENTDNAATFGGLHNISTRATTAATVEWTPADWTVRDEVSAAQGTPNLFTVVQEIVNRPGWQPNNALSFILSGAGSTNKRVADSFEGGAPASLSISYSVTDKAPVIAPIPEKLLDVTTAVGTSVMTAHVQEPKDAVVNWAIVDDVPFSIDAQGNILVSAALQAGTYQFGVQAGYLGAIGQAPVSITVAEAVLTPTITTSIAAKSDDAEENVTTGEVSLSSSDLELLRDGSSVQMVGLRFQGINIPQGATINEARIQFNVDETSTGDLTVEIKGEKADNTATFGGQHSISSRPVTTAVVQWTPEDWTIQGEVGEAQRTPDLSSILQEIINRSGWQRHNAVSFIISDTGSASKRVAGAFDSGAAATLSVSYSALNAAPVIHAITLPDELLNTSLIGSRLTTVTATDPEGDTVSWSLSGNVPLSIDNQGNITVNAALQVGSYPFEVRASDGRAMSSVSVTLTVVQATTIDGVLQTGDVTNIDAPTLLDATIATIENSKSNFDQDIQQLFGLDTDGTPKADGSSLTAIDWDPTHDASTIKSTFGMNTAVLHTNDVTNTSKTIYTKEIGIIGKTPSRYMVLGSNPMRNYYRDTASVNEQMQQFLENSLSWLTQRSDLKTAPVKVTIAQMRQSYYFPDEVAVRAWLDERYPGQVQYNAANACDDTQLTTCLAGNPELLIISQYMNEATDSAQLANAVQDAMNRGIPVLYMHYDGSFSELGKALFPLFNVAYEWDNYWKKLRLTDYNVTEHLGSLPSDVVAIQTMLNHFKAEDYAFDWSACDGENCSAVVGLESEFLAGATAVRSMMTTLDKNKTNLFLADGFRFQKLLALLGDKYRQAVSFPMDKDSTDDTVFMKSYFADHAVYHYRSLNPAQADIGNFSRSDFSHITPISKTVDRMSKDRFRSAGVYALPGQTVRVTRLDDSDVEVQVFVNSVRSGSTRLWRSNGYNRPKYVQSPWMTIARGETIAFTSPYGGPLQLGFDKNDLPVQLRFENIGEHPYWASSVDDTSFTTKLNAGEYDWAELVTPSFEVHSKLDKMRTSVEQWETPQNLAAKTMRYIHNFPHVLAGFKGDGIDVVPEIHNFATNNGLTVDLLDKVKHMNADQSTCGYGCSGNPYDAGWSFSPIGHGDVHELGHGLERNRFRFSGWEGHAVTNPYSYYTKSHYYKDTGKEPGCQNLPFENSYQALQNSINQADPTAYLQANFWATSNWSHQVGMTIQMMMMAQDRGVLQDGWHLLARLHILDREFNRAVNNETDWEAKRAGLGFSSYTLDEAKSITNNDWLVITISHATGLDYRDYIRMWGQEFSAKADTQVNGYGYTAVPRNYFMSSSNGYCKGEGFGGVGTPINGN